MQCSTSVGSSVWDLSIDEVQNWMFEQCMGCWVLASEKQMVYKWQMNELKSKRLPLASISKYDWKCQKKTSDPRRIIFQGPKLWTLNRSREKKKTGPSKTAPHPPHPFWEQEMGVASVAWRFLFKDCRPTLQYMTIHCWSFAGYDLYKSYKYIYIYMLYIFIHTFHYITLHCITFHSITDWWF